MHGHHRIGRRRARPVVLRRAGRVAGARCALLLIPAAYTRPHLSNIDAGLDCTGRLFISDRAHLVFDFHQIVDGLKEVELGGSSIGTTKKGIGPAYSAKASRSGLRVHHLFDHGTFAEKFRKIVENRFKRYGYFEYDTEGEIVRYQVRVSCYFIASGTYSL